jgi:hypothetical protein
MYHTVNSLCVVAEVHGARGFLQQKQCDQIGRDFAVWAHFSVFGRIFFLKNIAQIIWALFIFLISQNLPE